MSRKQNSIVIPWEHVFGAGAMVGPNETIIKRAGKVILKQVGFDKK